MAEFHTQRLTAAAAINFPVSGLYITQIDVYTGATPGSFSHIVRSPAVMHFPCPSDGTRGHKAHKIKGWKVNGTQLAAALSAFNGGVSAVVITMSTEDNKDPEAKPIESFRCVRASRATTGSSTLTFDETVGRGAAVKYALVLQSASTGRCQFPINGSFTQAPEAVVSNVAPPAHPILGLGEAASIVVTQTLDGAATQDVYAFY